MRQAVLAVVMFGFTSCTHYAVPQKIRTKTETEYWYRSVGNHKTSKWKKSSMKTAYERYDRTGNISEERDYGEYRCSTSRTKVNDSVTTISTWCSRIDKNINTVRYYVYDSAGRKTADSLWKYTDNKKDYLLYRTVFRYDTNNVLMSETEYDENDRISRQQDFSKNDAGTTVSKDSVANFLFEGITRVDGKRQDTTINDTAGRPLEKIHYYKDKFLYREEYRYDRFGQKMTILRYDGTPDNLWCVTEIQYDIWKRPSRKFWKVIGGSNETRDIYVYNRKQLLDKVLHYNEDALAGYTKYNYTFFHQ